MKQINKLLIFSLAIIFVYSCDTTNDSGYEPENYTLPQSFSLDVDTSALPYNVFQEATKVIYTPTTAGKGYFIVTLSTDPVPTSTKVHAATGANILESGEFNVDGSTPIITDLSFGVIPGTEYSVHAIHKSTDNFISESVVTTTFTILPCPTLLDGFVGTYSVSEQFTGGTNAPNGLSDFFGESYQIEITAMVGDTTGTKFVINNSAGFDAYFVDGTILTLGFDGAGAISFDDALVGPPNPVVAFFRIFEYDTTSSSTCDFTITCSGPLSVFGPYEFVLTQLQ